jgi:nitrate reductase NapE component
LGQASTGKGCVPVSNVHKISRVFGVQSMQKIEKSPQLEKINELNTRYKSVRQKSEIIAFIFLALFFTLFFLLPFKWNSVSAYVIGIWCFLQPVFIKKHSEYFIERAKLIPNSTKLSSVYKFFYFAGFLAFAVGTIFLMIELFFPEITNF